MRMAYAQLSEWTIQMFGRWGSATVLRYIREALLGRDGGNIAEIVEGVLPGNATIEMIKDYVNQIISAHAGVKEGLDIRDAAMFEDATLTHLEKQLLPAITKDKAELDTTEVMNVIFEKIAALEKQLIHKPVDGKLRWVMGVRGKKHIIWSGNVSHCARDWRPDKIRVCEALPKERAGWCGCCYRRASSVSGVGEGTSESAAKKRQLAQGNLETPTPRRDVQSASHCHWFYEKINIQPPSQHVYI